MDSLGFWILLTLSLIGTCMCWVRVLKSDDALLFKVAGLVFSAVPFVGPILFVFLDMPPRLPEDAQAKLEWRYGTTLYTDIRRKLFQGNRRYVAAMLGAREIEGDGNREYKRALRRGQKSDAEGN